MIYGCKIMKLTLNNILLVSSTYNTYINLIQFELFEYGVNGFYFPRVYYLKFYE